MNVSMPSLPTQLAILGKGGKQVENITGGEWEG